MTRKARVSASRIPIDKSGFRVRGWIQYPKQVILEGEVGGLWLYHQQNPTTHRGFGIVIGDYLYANAEQYQAPISSALHPAITAPSSASIRDAYQVLAGAEGEEPLSLLGVCAKATEMSARYPHRAEAYANALYQVLLNRYPAMGKEK